MSVTITRVPFAAPNPPRVESPTLLNLLILDHHRLVLEACREAATALRYRASTTESVEQTLWLMDSQSVDVVLLDLNLPGGVGSTFCSSSSVDVLKASLSDDQQWHGAIGGRGYEGRGVRLPLQASWPARAEVLAGKSQRPVEEEERTTRLP
jgi:response regulator receiver domain-containing protein